jgi:SnoaL-like domain
VTLIHAIGEGDEEVLSELLAEDVAFHSPVQTYRGREQVVFLLATIGRILEDIDVTRELDDVTFFAATVEEHPIDAVIVETTDAAGHVSEITLMARPLPQLQAAVARMARALAERG